ncbi:Protein YeeZ [Vibrio stylophorae]|uniref:Protein YeeZ n=1 Tax=Vibrio stylophorae TaxID=659351 RepID=A0ABN8DZ98_9VIBR|nr:NAD-dependent epimerase/dehydratase family protein [Vibrio stylophorae]CAH0535499.1 Protein YeeZ [Vibrio stylophorae]
MADQMRVLIIGAGWLGLPLAMHLQTQGHWVMATRRSEKKILDENLHGHVPLVHLDLAKDNAESHLHQLLKQHQVSHVVGCFPPGLRQSTKNVAPKSTYAKQWQRIVNACHDLPLQKIVMVSSTSVYPERAQAMREEDASLTLAMAQDNFSDRARAMLQAEQTVIDSQHVYAIVRCSGLIGPHRHPARFAARMAQVSDAAPANMLHQTDAIAILTLMLSQADSMVVNATSPETVSKARFYQQAITLSGQSMALPEINQQPDKRILATRICQLGYQFRYPNTLDALAAIEPEHKVQQ